MATCRLTDVARMHSKPENVGAINGPMACVIESCASNIVFHGFQEPVKAHGRIHNLRTVFFGQLQILPSSSNVNRIR